MKILKTPEKWNMVILLNKVALNMVFDIVKNGEIGDQENVAHTFSATVYDSGPEMSDHYWEASGFVPLEVHELFNEFDSLIKIFRLFQGVQIPGIVHVLTNFTNIQAQPSSNLDLIQGAIMASQYKINLLSDFDVEGYSIDQETKFRLSNIVKDMTESELQVSNHLIAFFKQLQNEVG